MTVEGIKINTFVSDKSNEMHLYDVMGCSVNTYDTRVWYTDPLSLYGLAMYHVVPETVCCL